MSYKPGDAFVALFCTSNPTTGAAANADSLPTATANKNGTDDGTFTLTVANIDTGRYKITGTIPVGYASGDVVNVTVAATVSAIAAKAAVASFVLDSKRLSDLVASGNILNDTAGTTTLLTRVAATVPTAVQIRQEIDTNSTKVGYSLASTGLDSIAVTAPTGVATTFPGMVVQTWRRFFKKAARTPTTLLTYADNGTTVVTTQTISDDGEGTESQGVAS